MDINVLIADDDYILRALICDIIKKQGYNPIPAQDGQKALDIFFGPIAIDLVILDVMMPCYDGWEVLKEIRKQSDAPIIMLTALGDAKHEISGLKKGADDYIAKPFNYEIFVARVNALLRKRIKLKSDEIKTGDIKINQTMHRVMVCGSIIDLNNKEYTLLIYLVNNKNIVLTREQILNSIWRFDYDGDIRTVDTHIKTLRAKLSVCGKYIKTVRGTGYLFEVDQNEKY